MPRRSHKCQCCPEPAPPCNKCSDGPVQLVIECVYSGDGGVVIEAATEGSGYGYGEISTKCVPTAETSGCITTVLITDGGSGYTSPPTATLAGGDPENPAELWVDIHSPIKSVTVTEGGSYSAAPSVTVASNALNRLATAQLFADLSAKVTSITVTNKGTGYTEPPAVFINGGGGSGATATATVSGGQVTAVTLTNQGSGYQHRPDVAFSGGGGSGAVATAQILGPVDRVVILDPGLYRARSTNEFSFPTISFSGNGSGAKAEIEWDGTVAAVVEPQAGCTGRGYDGEHEVTFSGGGGNGATATAYSVIAEAIVIDIGDGCGTTETNTVGFDSESSNDVYPLALENVEEPPAYEAARWTVTASVDLALREAITVDIRQWWVEPRPQFLNNPDILVLETHKRLLLRNYSRVEPDVTFELIGQPASAANAIISPQWTENEDESGNQFWSLSGVTLTSPGDNLLTSATNAAVLQVRSSDMPSNNASPSVPATYSFTPPEVASAVLANFIVQPVFNVTFRQTIPGRYELDTVTLVSGGFRWPGPFSAPATLPVKFTLSRGHEFLSYTVNATIANHIVTAVSIATRGGFYGAATLTSIGPIEDPIGSFFGSGTTTRTTTLGEPEVSARVVQPATYTGRKNGSGAELAVTLSEETDENDVTYYEVESVAVARGGKNYYQDQPVEFFLGGGSSVGLPALAHVNLPPREPPVIHAWWIDGGRDADLSFTFEDNGDDTWKVSDIEILNGGIGYTDGDAIRYEMADDNYWESGASLLAEIETDEEGTITNVVIVDGGRGWRQPSSIASVTVTRGGRYFRKVVTNTEIPIGELNCKENDWEVVDLLEGVELQAPRVGDTFTRFYPVQGAPSVQVESVRRCDIPEITVSLQ